MVFWRRFWDGFRLLLLLVYFFGFLALSLVFIREYESLNLIFSIPFRSHVVVSLLNPFYSIYVLHCFRIVLIDNLRDWLEWIDLSFSLGRVLCASRVIAGGCRITRPKLQTLSRYCSWLTGFAIDKYENRGIGLRTVVWDHSFRVLTLPNPLYALNQVRSHWLCV